MTEEDLNKMSVKDLFDLMIQQANVLFIMNKDKGDLKIIKEREQELALIQRVIVAKKADERPG